MIPRKKILLAPDSFKGCLSSVEVCGALAKGIENFDKSIEVLQFPSSDGGEGFCDCMQKVFGGEKIRVEVSFPHGDKGSAEFVYDIASKTAYVEMASAAGLGLVTDCKSSIMCRNTYGVGELICKAVEQGAEKIVVGLGGSATNDCGVGMLSALGVRFFEENMIEVEPYPYRLCDIVCADKSNMIDLSGVSIVAACDVSNPLCGTNGAAEVFSRQKGATEEEVKLLDKYAASFAKAMGIDSKQKGFGAAGGVGAALVGVLNASYVSGASLLVESMQFNQAISEADLVITGEGNTDGQTANGKLVSVVAEAAKRASVKTIVISGGLSEGYELLTRYGVSDFYSLTERYSDKDYCIRHAKELLCNLSEKIIGRHI